MCSPRRAVEISSGSPAKKREKTIKKKSHTFHKNCSKSNLQIPPDEGKEEEKEATDEEAFGGEEFAVC